MDNNFHINHYDTDKPELYIANYKRHFKNLRKKNIHLLELGVFRGGSLLFWRDYFPRGKIVGVDIEPVKINDPSGRIHVYQGLQQDRSFLDFVRHETAVDGFDIIIDDASHIGELTRISFWHLFENHLKDGGLYVIEDWRTGYWNNFPDGKTYRQPKEISFIKNFLKKIFITLLHHKQKLPENSKIKRYLNAILLNLEAFSRKKKYPSHNFGMVGVIKEFVDELGMDMITSPDRGSKIPHRSPKFSSMEICPGQVFLIKRAKY